MQIAARAAAGGGCPGSMPAAATAGAKGSLASRMPLWVAQRGPAQAGALEQRVAFSFPSCTGLPEGSGREEQADSGPASGGGLFC